ncbi:TlpA family protein disulfide reductase [Robiginitalea sp. IMCC44478]|uniref:TlpA family protein disulfide reductase n=1 Tax=Robiginitalea sp. IMCC44478 TaxID=3459122 RepID=UPI0040431B61
MALRRLPLLLLCFLYLGCNPGNNKGKFGQGWQKIPIELIEADPNTIEDLRSSPGRLRLLTVWASWCESCSEAFPNYMNLQRKYGSGKFEVVTLSVDQLDHKEAVLEFLRQKGAAVPNYIARVSLENQIMEKLDPDWAGELPLTLLLSPEGEVLYRRQGLADIEKLQFSIENQLFKQYLEPESSKESEKESARSY